jgi:uncharacterized tellurite resistance protein B-like protein
LGTHCRQDRRLNSFSEHALAALGAGVPAVLPAGELLAVCVTEQDLLAVRAALDVLRGGVEPDPRFGEQRPSEQGRVVVFRLEYGWAPRPTRAHLAGALLSELALAVAASDGEICDEERVLLENGVRAALDLSAAERARLHARLRWLVMEPPDPDAFGARLALLSPPERRAAAEVILGIAWADGKIHPGKRQILHRLGPLLGVSHELVEAWLNVLEAREPTAQPCCDETAPPTIQDDEAASQASLLASPPKCRPPL